MIAAFQNALHDTLIYPSRQLFAHMKGLVAIT